MTRAPFQVLVFPYCITANNEVLYAIFKRNQHTGGYWQGIAGGGEGTETPLLAAKREAFEEAGIAQENVYIQLESCATLPVVNVSGFCWGEDVLVIPEYTFGVQMDGAVLRLSHEHTEYIWVSYDDANALLRWDSNKNALWELNHRIHRKMSE